MTRSRASLSIASSMIAYITKPKIALPAVGRIVVVFGRKMSTIALTAEEKTYFPMLFHATINLFDLCMKT